MNDQANKARRKALQRWEGEGGSTAEGPQQSRAKRRPRDTDQRAKRIADIAKGEDENRKPTLEEEGKDPVSLRRSRRRGLKGG